MNVSPENIDNIVTLDGLRLKITLHQALVERTWVPISQIYINIGIVYLVLWACRMIYEYARVSIKKMACISFVDMSDLNWKPNELKSLL